MNHLRTTATLCLLLLAACTPSRDEAPTTPPETADGSGTPAPPAEAAPAEGSAAAPAAPAEGSVAAGLEEGGSSTIVPTELPGGWRAVQLSDLTSDQMYALAVGRRTRAQVSTRVVEALVTKMRESTEAAIPFCNANLPELLGDSVPDNVRLGRTSHKLRNPANVPPIWAAPHVDARTNVPVIVIGPEGQVAELTPILTSGLCLACHGAPESIAPPVSQALHELYPEDQATGFVENQLRGWFWIEVTPEA